MPMLPIPLPRKKRGTDAQDASIADVLIWMIPFVFLMPAMFAVGISRIVLFGMREDFDRYLKRLAALLETSLKSAVAYRGAGATKGRPSPPPARTATITRPGEMTRPGQKPGTSRSHRRTRARR